MGERLHPHLVVPLTQELQLLGLLVHEDSLEVAGAGRAQLDGLIAPAHHLVGLQVCCMGTEDV